MIADGLRNICGDRADIESLMGPGTDPHLYKATLKDLEKLSEADIIFYNGLHLEGKMTEIFHKLSRTRRCVSLSDTLGEEDIIYPEGSGTPDPHIWFDVKLWKKCILYAARQLIKTDTLNISVYKNLSEEYASRLDSLDTGIRLVLKRIPQSKRVLITSHDAFSYFGRAYGIEVKGLQGISTAAEFGLRDVSSLVNFITERQIPAVFIETSVSGKAMEAVMEGCNSRGYPLKNGGELYSDAMGFPGTSEGTYIGMLGANAKKIAKELSK
jgi:manganese/zinc/iron transport system substrate-binding protein